MFNFKSKNKNKLPDLHSHIEANLANSKIHIKNVEKVYHSAKGDTLAMKDVNLNVLENEFVCIVGPSGCGKSTLFPWMTVEENIRFGLKLKKMPKSEQDPIVDKYLKVTKLEKFRNNYPKELSGGMKQRVAIARALANSPEVILMDEPFGALDPQTKAEMQLLMREIWQVEKPTIIFVTHDIDEAVFLGSKVVVITERPGTVKEEIRVLLPYNRDLDLKDTEEFLKIRKHVNDLIYK